MKPYIRPITSILTLDDEDMMIITPSGNGVITDQNNNSDSNINVNLTPVAPDGGIAPAKYYGYHSASDWDMAEAEYWDE